MRPLKSVLVFLGLLIVPVVAAAQTTYVAFGDSITEGVGDETNQGGYPTRLQANLRAGGVKLARVRNRGLASEDTTEGIVRVTSVLNEGGEFFLLMEGTNDLHHEISVETTLFNLEDMAKRARARGMEVVLATLAPRFQWADVDRNNFQTRLINQGIRDIAGRRSYLFADVFEIYFTIPDFSPDLYAYLPGDGIGHPNSEGYDIIARVFADGILGIDTVPPVLGLTEPENFSSGQDPQTALELEIWDFISGADTSATDIKVNGVKVGADVRGNASRKRISFDPQGQLTGLVTVDLVSRDLAAIPNEVDRSVLFFIVDEGGSIFEGDLNLNGRVDGVDLAVLGTAFGSTTNRRRYIVAADINGDGIVDGLDLAALADNFGETR
ncbi:MAG: GDSL-type esterase/lipase family protein [Acidobacteriota bacterium]|nr:GDSL-type esterase/lipase family protein [Acidobacteriota bacterium]